MTVMPYTQTILLFTMMIVTITSSQLLNADDVVDKTTADTPSETPLDALTPEAQKAADELIARLPKESEARAMLDHILKGSRLGPGEGWFRLAVSQTRYGWDYVCNTFDTNNDQSIGSEEFPGTPHDFARLDRDGDGALTEEDFDWSQHSLERTPGTTLFFQADRDANGKLTRDELNVLFQTLDTDSRGFLALNDLREQFQPQENSQRNRRTDAPNRSTLVLGLQRQEIGSLQPGPNVGQPAPDFSLSSLDGRQVTLSKEVGELPIVLIFGNFTCGPFRSQSGNLTKLYERYKDRAKFFLVYVREAHPSDGWSMNSNQRVGIDIAQPQKNQQRVEIAASCQRHLNLDLPFLVDSVDDQVGATYSGMPNRLYLIDSTGTIAFKNGRGPFGFHTRELEQSLVLLLNESTSKTVNP